MARVPVRSPFHPNSRGGESHYADAFSSFPSVNHICSFLYDLSKIIEDLSKIYPRLSKFQCDSGGVKLLMTAQIILTSQAVVSTLPFACIRVDSFLRLPFSYHLDLVESVMTCKSH